MTAPRWQLPPGCTPGGWEYVTSDEVASDYDRYFASHDLMSFDEAFVCELFCREAQPGQTIADFGCGTGRILLQLAEHGFRGLAIDLSRHMLQQVRRKAEAVGAPIETVEGNWVELDSVSDAAADHGVSLFSSLGMIHGRPHRVRALRETHRILRPGGWFVLHVHNFWFNLYDQAGIRRVAQSFWKDWTRTDWERGDKYYNYRGVSNMFLHSFAAREIRADLREAGFQSIRLLPIRSQPHQWLTLPWLAPSLRAIGWMIVCRRPPAANSEAAGSALTD